MYFNARGECGRYPLYVVYICRCIKYWNKLTRMNRNRYPYKCYKLLKNVKLRVLLSEYGVGYVWLTENGSNVNEFMRSLNKD